MKCLFLLFLHLSSFFTAVKLKAVLDRVHSSRRRAISLARARPRPVLSRYRGLFSFPDLGTLPFSKSGTPESPEIRSRIGRQSVGRTLRGLLLSRRSLPFKTASCPHFSAPSPLARPPHPGSSRRSPPCFSSHPPRVSRPALTRLSFPRSVLLSPSHPWETGGSHVFPASSLPFLTSPNLATLTPTGEFLACRLLFRAPRRNPDGGT